MQGGVAFADPASAVAASTAPSTGFGVENSLPNSNPFDFLERRDSNVRSPTALGTSPTYPSMAGMPYLDPGLRRYLDDLRGKLDTSPAAGDERFPFGTDGSAWRAFPDNFNPRIFGYDRPDDRQSFADPLIRPAGVEDQPSFTPYYPTYPVASPPNPLQKAFDQLSQIYARVGLDPLNRFNGQGAGTSPTGLRADEVSPAMRDAFDPQYIVPQQAELHTKAGPAESSRGLGIEPLLDNPPDPGVTADGFTTDDYLDDTSGDPAVAIRRPGEDGVYSTAYSDFESPPGGTRIDRGVDSNAFKYIGTQGLGLGPTPVGGAQGDPAAVATVSGTFDPRYIVQTGTPPNRPPGPGHNGGPPLGAKPPTQIPTQPSRSGPIQGAPAAQQTPDNSAAVGGAAEAAAQTGPDEPQDQSAPSEPETDDKLEAWQALVAARGTQLPGGQYLGPGGVNTAIGVRLHPRLPEPAAGRGYLPAWRHLRNGYRGELELANRIVSALPNEIVLHYGMPAGRSGPDVISLSPGGVVSVWDSKWRSGQRSIGPNEQAHQSNTSFESLKWEIRRQIIEAVTSGRLSPDVAVMARRNIDAGNFDIYTIGTGNAHSGVKESVRNNTRSDARRQ
jgi:hypothetical protein